MAAKAATRAPTAFPLRCRAPALRWTQSQQFWNFQTHFPLRCRHLVSQQYRLVAHAVADGKDGHGTQVRLQTLVTMRRYKTSDYLDMLRRNSAADLFCAV
jgi:hypothetical protein